MLKYLIPLFVLLISSFAYAEKYDRDYRQNALGGIISQTEKRIEELAHNERMRKYITGATVSAESKSPGTREIEIKKNYPVVPYDPNHPNVQKEKKAKFNVSAKAKTLARRFGKGLNAAALGLAVAELIGEGVDWVLDPENNSVRYNTPDGYMWRSVVFDDGGKLYPNPQMAAQANCNVYSECIRVKRLRKIHETTYEVIVSTENIDEIPAWTVTRVEVDQEQSLSLDTIAQHIINNEHTTNNITNNITNHYHEAVNDTITDQIDKGENDDDIRKAVDKLADDKTDSNTDTSTENKDETDGKTEEETDDKTATGSKFPDFCTWAKPVCDFIDWVKQEPPEPEGPKQVPHATLSDLGLDEDELFKQRVNFDGQCPQHQLSFVVNGYQIMEPIPIHHFCNILEQIAPWLLAFSYLSSGFFVIRSL